MHVSTRDSLLTNYQFTRLTIKAQKVPIVNDVYDVRTYS